MQTHIHAREVREESAQYEQCFWKRENKKHNEKRKVVDKKKDDNNTIKHNTSIWNIEVITNKKNIVYITVKNRSGDRNTSVFKSE